MVTTRSMSRTNNKTKATRVKSSANYGTTKKVDPKDLNLKWKGKWGNCSEKYATKKDIIMFTACCQFMENVYLKEYFEKHPCPTTSGLPYEIDFAEQDEWLNMSDEAKRPWIELAKKMEA